MPAQCRIVTATTLVATSHPTVLTSTPKAIVDRLHAEILKIVATPEVQARLKNFGMLPSSMTTVELADYQKAEVSKWAKVIKSAGIKAE